MPTSLGPAEILVILVVALIVLGPKRLPEAGRQVGKAIAEVRKWSQGFQNEIKSVIDPDISPPSYRDPQPGYQPPIPVIPAETAPPSDDTAAPPSDDTAAPPPIPVIPAETAPPSDHTAAPPSDHTAAPPSGTNGNPRVTTGSHGLVSGPPTDAWPEWPVDAVGPSEPTAPSRPAEPSAPTEPSEPPTGESPRT